LARRPLCLSSKPLLEVETSASEPLQLGRTNWLLTRSAAGTRTLHLPIEYPPSLASHRDGKQPLNVVVAATLSVRAYVNRLPASVLEVLEPFVLTIESEESPFTI
jgi:hypothetical protein